MNQKSLNCFGAILVVILLVIPKNIDCHRNPLISVCPGEGMYTLDFPINNTSICLLIFGLFPLCDIFKKITQPTMAKNKLLYPKNGGLGSNTDRNILEDSY